MGVRLSPYGKKTLNLNQHNINKAVKLLGAKTETQAVNEALEILVQEEAIVKVHKKMKRQGGIRKIYR